MLNILEDGLCGVSGLCNRLPALICQSVVKGNNYVCESKLPGGNLIIAGRDAHPVQGRKLQLLAPLEGFQDQKPIIFSLPKQVLGLTLRRCGYKQ